MTLSVDDFGTGNLETGEARFVDGAELVALAKAVDEFVARKRDGSSKTNQGTQKEAPDGWGRRVRDGA